jgi:hypothetical protein
MNNHSCQLPRPLNTCLIAVAFAVAWVAPAQPQYEPSPPKNYANYYSQHLQQYHRPPVDPRDYRFDKYYYHNPNISPYLNLVRHNQYGNNYYQRVLPEVERRAVANAPERSKPVYTSPVPTGVVANLGPTHSAVPTPAYTGVEVPKSYGNSYLKNFYGR